MNINMNMNINIIFHMYISIYIHSSIDITVNTNIYKLKSLLRPRLFVIINKVCNIWSFSPAKFFIKAIFV